MEANPYYLRDGEGNYYNQYPEFQIWEAGRQAGIKEVVDFVDTYKLYAGNISIPGKAWQAKPKEWGGNKV